MEDLLFKFVAVASVTEDVYTFNGLIIKENETTFDVLCPRFRKFIKVSFSKDYIENNLRVFTAMEDDEVIKGAVRYFFSNEFDK